MVTSSFSYARKYMFYNRCQLSVICHSVNLFSIFNVNSMLRLLLMIHIRNMNNHVEQQLFLIRHLMQNDEADENILLTLPAILFNIDHCRMPGFYDVWLDRYLNYDFFSLFRMSKNTFEKLLHKLHCEERHFNGGSFPPVSTEQQLLITLWWLGKGEVLLSVADRFNVAVSTVHKATDFMLTRIINLQRDYIVWPNMEESQTIRELFQDQGGYPGVVGAIDVCNVPFKAPLDQQESYIDRKMQHSIKLQAVVGPQKTFLYTNIGFPGSVHDSRVLRNSTLFVEIEQNGNFNDYFYDANSHLIGDSAYPLRSWLITPYRDNGALNDVQRRHNYIHSRTRMTVEMAFGILKSRWRILHYINVNSIIKAIRIITASCILHNFCYVNLDFWENYEVDIDLPEPNNNNNLNNDAALRKRDHIANNL